MRPESSVPAGYVPGLTSTVKLPAPVPDAEVMLSQGDVDAADQVLQPSEKVTVADCAAVFSAPLFVAPKKSPVRLTATRVLAVGTGVAPQSEALEPGLLGFGGGVGFGSVGPGEAGGLLFETVTLIERAFAKALVTVLFAKTEIW
jgi:hypothetical protein